MVSVIRKPVVLGVALAVVSGCGATHTAITKRNMEVKTRMSDTIFLSPVQPKEQVVFVRIRNTSGLTSLNIEPEVKRAIQSQGYKITTNPDKANFLLQANVIQAGRVDDSRDLMGSYGEALSTGLLGAAIGNMSKNKGDGAITGAAAGAAVGFIANTLVQDVTYSIITDIQVSERAKEKLKQTVNTTIAQGNIDDQIDDIKSKTNKNTLVSKADGKSKGGGSTSVTKHEFTETTPWKQYRTRVISYANKMNLAYEDAQPKLVENMANALAGVF